MRKNILILGHSYYGPQFVDINNQYTALFDKKNYQVTVAYLIGPPNSHIEKKHSADQVIFFNLNRAEIRYLKCRLVQTLLRLCREKQFEIVIGHRYKACYALLWVNQFCKIPAIFFVMHELGTVTHFSRRLLIALLSRKNMMFVGVSDAVRNDIRHSIWSVKPSQVMTLHNMLNIAATEKKLYARAIARQKLHLLDDSFIFGTVGRLAINKDQKTLITAFSIIKPHCPHAKLVIAGDGQLENDLRQYVAHLQLAEEILFTGYLNDAVCFMKAFDIFVLSSIQEAFGMVLLEAMTAKIPIIATRVNGIPEVMGKTGTLINPSDPTELASAMLKAYNTPQSILEEQAQKGYDRTVQHFSIEQSKQVFWSLPLTRQLKELR